MKSHELRLHCAFTLTCGAMSVGPAVKRRNQATIDRTVTCSPNSIYLHYMPIPEDFPRDPYPGALPGAQEKLLARLINGRFVVGLTEEELEERYDACIDLVKQLVPYCLRKQSENPSWTAAEVLRRVDAGLQAKKWGQSRAEIRWTVNRLAAELGWPQPTDASPKP